MRVIHPILAVTDRVPTRYLVVEGWIHEYAIDAAISEFRNGTYEVILTTGGPVQGTGLYTNDFNTSASVAAERLVAKGMSPSLVHMVPSRAVNRDRTYSSAQALRTWLNAHAERPTAITILTEGLHARRTRLLYRLAFEHSVDVGIIAVRNPDYDSARWWRYSEGVREVLGESIAFLYARLFFYPAEGSEAVVQTQT